MNPVTGEKIIEISGGRYVLRFTWLALSEIEQKHGDDPNLFDASVIAEVAAAGLRERHPEMTAEKLMELSPPLFPLVQAVQEALQWAYFGPEKPGPAGDIKKNRPAAGLWPLIKRLFRPGSVQTSSGS